jgi:hypothetical protein
MAGGEMTIDNEDVQSTGTEGIWKGVVTGKFYFSDETFDLNGPYDTIPEAVIGRDSYVAALNGPKAVNKTGNLPQCNVKYYGD